jgi:hypothetical protein
MPEDVLVLPVLGCPATDYYFLIRVVIICNTFRGLKLSTQHLAAPHLDGSGHIFI